MAIYYIDSSLAESLESLMLEEGINDIPNHELISRIAKAVKDNSRSFYPSDVLYGANE